MSFLYIAYEIHALKEAVDEQHLSYLRASPAGNRLFKSVCVICP